MDIHILIVTSDQACWNFAQNAAQQFKGTEKAHVSRASSFVAAKAMLRDHYFDVISICGDLLLFSDSPGLHQYGLQLASMIIDDQIPCGCIIFCPHNRMAEIMARELFNGNTRLIIRSGTSICDEKWMSLCFDLALRHRQNH